MGGKFDDVDREVIKEWLENHLKTKLKQIGPKKKYFLGDYGKCYCILGGQVFHGIPKEIIDSEARECSDTELIIVKKDKNKFEIYMNSIEKLIENKDKLSYSEPQEEYKFIIEKKEDFLKIKELQNIPYYLEKVGEFPYDDQKRNQAEINFKIYKILDSFPEEEKERKIKEYKSKGTIQSIF